MALDDARREGEVADPSPADAADLPRGPRPLPPSDFGGNSARGRHLAAFLEACDAADWLRSAQGGILPQHAAAVALGRTLAARMDELEGAGWVNEAGKPDTTTAPQYLRVLDSLRLTPQAAAKAAPKGRQARGQSALEGFRRRSFEAVG